MYQIVILLILLRHLHMRLNSLRKYNNISKATVTIHKPNSPLKELVEDISVTASEEF